MIGWNFNSVHSPEPREMHFLMQRTLMRCNAYKTTFLILHTCISAFFDILSSKMVAGKKTVLSFSMSRGEQDNTCNTRVRMRRLYYATSRKPFEFRTGAYVKIRAKRLWQLGRRLKIWKWNVVWCHRDSRAMKCGTIESLSPRRGG